MERSELEQFFDKYIMDNSWKLEEEVKEKLGNELAILGPAGANGAAEKAVQRWSDNAMDLCPQVPPTARCPGGGPGLPQVQEVAVSDLTPWPGTHLQIQNVVSNVNLGCKLDLNFIAQRAWNIQYKPQSQIILMRIRKPRTAAWVSKSGSINCMGAKSEVESRVALRRYARKLQKLGFPVRFLNFRVTTLMASGKIFPVDLTGLWSAHRDQCRYEPELNPWLYYTGFSGINVKIFSTGGVSFVGAKTKVQAHKVFNGICSMLSRFRRP